MKSLKQVAVAAALGTMMLATRAHADPFTAGSYYEDNIVTLCNAIFCRAIFDPIPAGNPLVVTSVSCSIEVRQSILVSVELTMGPRSDRSEYLGIGPAMVSGNINHHAVHEEVQFYYRPGQRPAVHAISAAGVYVLLRCRIAGTRPAPV